MPRCIDIKHIVSIPKVLFTSEYPYSELYINTKSKKCFQSQDLEACIDTYACVLIQFAKNHNFNYYRGLYRYKHAKYRYHTLGIDTKPSCIDTTCENSSFWWCKGLISILRHRYKLHIPVASWFTSTCHKQWEIDSFTHLNDSDETMKDGF